MRRRWPVLAATIPLAVGWSLAAAYPAAASTSVQGPGGLVQPGGPVSQLSQSVGPPTGSGAPGGIVTPQVSGGQPQVSGGRNTIVTSSNWAGYVATGPSNTFNSVSAKWTEPTGHCTSGDQYSAFWVGLDGYTSSTVEQTGSEVDCVGRTPQYYAWYELYPGASVTFTNPVSAGDQFSGSVTSLGSGNFTLVLQDVTKGWTQTKKVILAGASLSSAEAIAEAPCCTARGGILPLTNFGTANFSSVMANGKIMATYTPVEITMPDTSVSAMSNAGSFSVSYEGFSGFPWPFGGF